MKTFATDLPFSNLMLDVEARNFLLQEIPNHMKTHSPKQLKIDFFIKTSLENVNDFLSVFFNLNTTIVLIKALKHLLKVTEATTCSNGIEIYHIKMVNDFISYSG